MKRSNDLHLPLKKRYRPADNDSVASYTAAASTVSTSSAAVFAPQSSTASCRVLCLPQKTVDLHGAVLTSIKKKEKEDMGKR